MVPADPDPPSTPPEGTPGPADEAEPKRRSLLPDDHWSKTRDARNHEALDYLRERSRAPGVESGGTSRNQYCMECGGVLPLSYDSFEPADRSVHETCPHCGAEVNPTVRAMFNWVEIDQVPPSDVAALLPFLVVGVLVLVLVAALFVLG
jgi:hypothetical protein